MIEMYLALFLLCSPDNPTQCQVVNGPMFPTEEACYADLTTNGIAYLNNRFGSSVHIASMHCLYAELEGEST